MPRLRGSVAFRLAVGYGALVVGAMAAVAAALYIGTVGVIDREIDIKLHTVSKQLLASFSSGGVEDLHQEIQELLTDNADQDTEVYLLLKPGGTSVIGNIAPPPVTPAEQLADRRVIRYGRPSLSRLLRHPLPNGYMLIVGRDLADLNEIEQLVLRALLVGGAIALVLAVAGALVFRRQLEEKIAKIRRTAQDIEAGDMSRRIPESDGEDEFTRLNHSINRMLDRIQRLMDGARDVSNAIAHDLRTPLARIRGLLDESVAPTIAAEDRLDRTRAAIRAIDDLVAVFDKLLQIAEAELGVRRQLFQPVTLGEIVTNVADLYDAAAEANRVRLVADIDRGASTLGDRDLLASAAANLVDNALKYAGEGATVTIRSRQDADTAAIVVEDDGPGIPAHERANVVGRFYQLDRSRTRPGNGLGLAIVNAICHLHGGSLSLEDARPGLRAVMALPRVDRAAFPNGNSRATATLGAIH